MIVDDNIIKQHGLVVAAVYAVIVATPTIKQAEIARECNISIKTAQRALETLQQVGYIRIKNNKPNSNIYEILDVKKRKEVYGAFGHVQLSTSEYQGLMQDYGETTVTKYIKRLDDYLEIHPEKHYSAHHQVLRNWIEDGIENEKQKTKRSSAIPRGAKYWYGGKTYGELIADLPNHEQKEYLSFLKESDLHQVATEPLENFLQTIKEKNEYMSLMDIISGEGE